MRILIVDDERNIRESLKKYLSLEDIDSEAAASGEEALALLEEKTFDAAVLDLRLPGMNGQELLEQIQEKGFPVPVIMISAHGQIADAVEALKSGARDYLSKPVDPAELIIKIRSLVDNRRRENLIAAESRRRAAGKNHREGSALIGESPAMQSLSAQINKLAGTDVTVLITGESGSGKEVAAREIHRRSASRDEPFAAVNIGGIHESLMESELFGHEKGSFTGAAGRRQGLFELAGRGSIFLDEIGEMPMPLQVKLLRVLQERKIRRLGGITDIPVNARIISATNRDVEALVRKGSFREDLYYRLNVFRLHLPPLRERREDIPLLADFLLGKLCSRMGRSARLLSPAARGKIAGYDFPGNVRELENILERALIFCEGETIEPGDIDIHVPLSRHETPDASAPAALSDEGVSADHGAGSEAAPEPVGPESAEPRRDPPILLDDIEKNAILAALVRHGGNRTKAAQELGITRKTILNKLKSYGME
ncbi:MAG: sigma-54 dependent transcriptional regulator [Spirochaetaceae bacterium]|jgi:two-component system response regulator AtoC|nr:sigma-54 dependent transcriptional regulator [Spirochaetaceae bacterium]